MLVGADDTTATDAPGRALPADVDHGAPRTNLPRREAVVVGGVAAVVYLLTRSAVPALTHDSLTYLQAIEHGGEGLFHPHHLAYNALSRVWLDLWTALGLGNDSLRVVESLNALLGAASAVLVWLTLRTRAGLARGPAAIGTGGAGLSYGFWYYSVSLEVYLLGLVLLLAAFLVLTSPRRTPGVIVAVGVLNGLAVLGHQANVLFGIVVVIELARRVDRATAARRIALYGATAAGVVVAAYGAVLALVVRPASVDQASNWFTRYAQAEGYWHLEPGALVESTAGLGRALVGGQFAYRLDGFRERATAMFPGKSLVDEMFLVRDLPPAVASALVVLAVLGGVLLAATVAVGLWRRRNVSEPGRSLLHPLLVWFVVYSAFFVVWEPLNPEFHIPQVTVLWMVAAVLITATPKTAGEQSGPGARRAAAGLLVATACVAVANAVGTVLPATDARNDVYAARYTALSDVVTAGDLVLVDHPHLGVGYTARHTDAEAVVVTDYVATVALERPPMPSAAQVAAQVERAVAGGHRVVVDAHLVIDPSNEAARLVGAELLVRFGGVWRELHVTGSRGWYVIDAAGPVATMPAA